MFKIEEFLQDEDAKTLTLSENLFHDALKDRPQSKARYHVKNDKGEDFDIVYWDNDKDIEPYGAYPAYVSPPFMIQYYLYNENEKDTIYIDFFKGFKYMIFEELNEYTIAISRVVLNYTDMDIWCNDARIKWFIEENPRLHVVDELPKYEYESECFYIQEQFRTGMEDNNYSRLSSTYAFHNVFFLQWILNGKSFHQFKFVTMPINDTGGIGGLLSVYKRYQKGFEAFGLKFAAPDKDKYGRFPRDLVERYFAVDLWDKEANESNTLIIENLVIFVKTKFFQMQPGEIEKDIIAPGFLKEMDEYYDAVFGGQKTLGILIRGSDYIATGLSGSRKMATVEQMAPTIRRWMSEYGYEKIFLATEDSEILKQMRNEFGKTMVALSQHRLSIKDLKAGQIIADYEKENSGDDYIEILEDTTVNYFYALYLLSRCNAFMCSGQCDGWDTVCALNNNEFERTYRFAVGINGDPRTEDWREIGPITAGMFARGVYPVDKPFYMTYRFDLKEKVNADALKVAWDKTIKVYPYATYATVTRRSDFVFTENPLDFVIEETGEVIEPSTPEANFHTVTFCYLGNTLWIYADHIPYDGTGFKMVLETFFYHYYCTIDGCEYPVPEGVYSENDGVVDGQDIDAYLQVEPIDPKALMGVFGNQDIFQNPENPKEGIFVPKPDCRAFCISVPSEPFVKYAKSVNGSPMSAMAVCVTRALKKVHPENTLPYSVTAPVSIRKIMGNTNSLLPQVVHYAHNFSVEDLVSKTDEALNAEYRNGIKGFSSEQGIKMAAGVYRSVCEGYAKAFRYGALNKITMDQRKNAKSGTGVSYLGTMRAGDYGKRIRMTAFHVMQEKGISIHFIEIGNYFYIDWYQGFHKEDYVKALRDVLEENGIDGITIERVE